MPKKIDPKVEGIIIGLSTAGLTHRSILGQLKILGFTVSQTFISRVLNNTGKRRQAKTQGLPSPVKVQPPKVVTPAIIRKIKAMTSRENPPSQSDMTGRGTLPLIQVPKKVKVTADFYIDHVLRPLLEIELPKLYPGELHKVTVHHDAASSHTAKKTTAYAADLKARLGITIISNQDIPVKAPDTSPLDFFGFGYLKRRLFRRSATTEKGLWKLMREEWSRIDLPMVTRVFGAWKRRLRLVVKKGGHHIENTKDIHKRHR